MTAFKKVPLPNVDNVKFDKIIEFLRTLLRAIDATHINLSSILNRGVSFTDNVDSVLLTFTSSATPDAQNTVAHTLGKIPTGYIVYSKDKAGDVYLGGTAWTATNIYLKVDVASVAVKVIVF